MDVEAVAQVAVLGQRGEAAVGELQSVVQRRIVERCRGRYRTAPGMFATQ